MAFFFLRSSTSFLPEERRITLGNQRPGEKFRLLHSRIVERMASGTHMPLDKVQQDRWREINPDESNRLEISRTVDFRPHYRCSWAEFIEKRIDAAAERVPPQSERD